MAGLKRIHQGADSRAWARRADPDGAIAAQRWAFIIVAVCAAVALLHALW